MNELYSDVEILDFAGGRLGATEPDTAPVPETDLRRGEEQVRGEEVGLLL